MPAECSLYLAPGGAGKTAFAVELARAAARGLSAEPRVLVASYLQAASWRRRLARAGGALGVRVRTFDRLCADVLAAACRQAWVELSEPVEYRLLRAVVDATTLVDATPLVYYRSLTRSPGFTQVLERLIAELQAAGVGPAAFAAAVARLGDEPRLAEIAAVYTGYAAHLEQMGWTGHSGLGGLALAALAAQPDLAADWGWLVVDGFDTFTPVQLAFLQAIAGRAGHLVVTLTAARPSPAHGRLAETRQKLEHALGVAAVPLPSIALPAIPHPALSHLEANLFRPGAGRIEAGGALELLEAPERAGEARAALRWLRQRMLRDGIAPGELALLARTPGAYRPFILESAAEFGLPLRLAEGVPLRHNPAVAALLDLLRLALPLPGGSGELSLLPRLVVEAWRSPYFDWSAESGDDEPAPVDIRAGDAGALDAVARWGRVLGGLSQWREVLDDLAARPQEGEVCATGASWGTDEARGTDDERGVDAGVPTGEAAAALRDKLARFTRRLTPPAARLTYRAFVAWFESLIGGDPLPASQLPASRYAPPRSPPEERTSLQVVAQARRARPDLAERDLAALLALKDVLRGLVWADESLGNLPVDYAGFVGELTGALEGAQYLLPPRDEQAGILVAGVAAARGLPFRAVAILGLAEGEFPAAVREDPFLPDADRERLRDECGLPIRSSTESAEAQWFYEAAGRPRERLLLTRPLLADNGAPWPASPFWDEVVRLSDVKPVTVRETRDVPPAEIASWPELLEAAAYDLVAATPVAATPVAPTSVAATADGRTRPRPGGLAQEAARRAPQRWLAVLAAGEVFRRRARRPAGADANDGDLSAAAAELRERFGPTYFWSATRLEKHGACPYYAFAANVLGLSPREEPAIGLDVRQLGSIYHRILEQLYASAPNAGDLAELLARLPAVARAVLDDAPRRDGFRPDAWWPQSRAEIERNLRRTVQALETASQPEGWVSIAQELAFMNDRPLLIRDGEDTVRVRGFIDRVDAAPDGRLRVIDYKTPGPDDYKPEALAEGKKLQMAIYGLALRDALGHAAPVEGFYWHILKAVASPLTLATYPGGPEGAVADGVSAIWRAVRAARAGQFTPQAPAGGCPDYCPAAGFCWHYRARAWGEG